jgi:EAL and modified HD-GYP domain-containing signal transduction protein
MAYFFVHKEPVLDGKARAFAEELIFRRSASGTGENWQPVRVDEDIAQELTPDGLRQFVGNRRTFLNVAVETFRGDALASLPHNCIFLVSNQDLLDKEVLLKSTFLRKKGYQVGVEEGRLSPLHQTADFVCIDTSGKDGQSLGSVMESFRGLPGRKIAVNVQTEQVFRDCKSLGFDLFQGSFFMDPSVRPPEPISDSQVQLLQLWKDLRSNEDVGVIESSFKNSPKLTYNLFQLINSAFFGVSVKVVSIRQAITLLGYDRLLKWVVLLLYGVSPHTEQTNPVVEKAVLRGRIMETLARDGGRGMEADSAFITGMLSFFPVLFDIRLSDLAMEMKLGQEIREALIAREGFLGALLNLAEKTDLQAYGSMMDELTALKLSMGDLLRAETDAIIDAQSRLFG